MILSLALLLGSVTLSTATAIPACNQTSPFNWHETNFLLAFGNSYTFVRGTYGRENYSFIGDLQNYAFTPTQLFTNKIIQNQTSTSAGGPNWVEYLTKCFSGLPSKCKTQLWDFAFAGSDISTSYTPLHHDYTVSLEDQITQWSRYASPFLKPNFKKALVAVFIGINDINDSAKYTFPRNGTVNFDEFYDLLIRTEFAALEKVYAAGYRNFLFVGLPPLDKTPSNLVAKTPLPNTTMVKSYNSILASHAATFQATHPESKAMVFDTYSYLNTILAQPAKYGITNTTNFCARYNAPDIATNYAAYGCAPIEQYFWYNSGHITYRVHELLAGAINRFLGEQSVKKGGRW